MAMYLVRRGAQYLPKAFVSPRALPKPGNAVRVCRALVLGGLLLAGVLTALHPTPAAAASSADWPMFGLNLQNTASDGRLLGEPANLKVKWTFTTGGDVSARAAVVNGIAYIPDWGGNLWAVDARSGAMVWGHQLSDYGLPAATHSRTSPAVVAGVVYVGTQEGAWLLAIDAAHGTLLWKTQLESPLIDPFALVTASPVVSGNIVYTGVASNQEALAAFIPGFVCCTNRGSVVAVNALNGAIVWKTYTVPSGYTGGDIWGSSIVVDPTRGSLFVGTGNNFSHPTDPAYVNCIANGGNASTCTSPDNHVDSILALSITDGRIKWATKFVTWNQFYAVDGSDDWNVACFIAPYTNCPPNTDSQNTGPDYDFASGPNLITYQTPSGGKKTILGAGQKSGIYFALNPDTGATLWQTQVGPGSSLGGMEWGSASDGKRIYVAIANFYGIPYSAGGAGSWAALDPATGAILWQVADPNGAVDLGPLAVADGVVFASSMAGSATAPTMLGLSANNGKTLWSYAAGSSVNAGATISNGVVYWGSGYTHLGIPGYTGNNKFYAFSNNGK
jgi:polyvinyl alcohol dehydrogenase (cytochrome)